MTNNNLEICVVDVEHISLYSFSNDMVGAEEKLQKALDQQIESINTWEKHCKTYNNRQDLVNYLTEAQNKKYEIMTFNEFLELQRNYYLNKPLTEITEDEFHEMLNVLPPLKWTTRNNIEMFCMSEMLTGSFTSQYLHDRDNNKFYHKTVDILDSTTWGYNFIQ